MSRSQVQRPRGVVHFGDDDTGCTILHVDMDAFYALVEVRDQPELRGTPVIVGATGGRGVVLSATYEARAMGVHSAMPMSRALRLAPDATVVPPRHHEYAEVSRAVMNIFESVTPLVEPLSLDEAFLDVKGALRLMGSPVAIAQNIRERVAQEQGITCSVGISTVKFVAKLASTRIKPDGLLLIPHDQILAFIHPLPVSALWGVGAKTEEHLHRLGLHTISDIAHTPRATLVRALGSAHGEHLYALAWGNDDRSVVPHTPDKSIGNEETFDEDTDDHEIIRTHVVRLADQVAGRLRAAALVGRTVQLKVRFADFSVMTRSRTLVDPTDVGKEIYDTAWALFTALGLQRARIRLVGVRMEGLSEVAETPQQLVLDAPDHGRRDAEVAVDHLRRKYGRNAVQPGRLVGRPETQD